jgi:hypothetical protein
MKRDPHITLVLLVCVFVLVAITTVGVAEINNIHAFHAWNDIIIILTTILAAMLSIISYIGYRRDGRTKVLLVTLAFLIFTLKGVFIITGDIFGGGVDPVFNIFANLLDFIVLACLFVGMTMK